MSTLADHYRDLLNRENVPFQELVAHWPRNFIEEIRLDFVNEDIG